MNPETITKMFMLMDIVHKAASAGPEFAWVGAAARAALNDMRALPAPAPEAPPSPPLDNEITPTTIRRV